MSDNRTTRKDKMRRTREYGKLIDTRFVDLDGKKSVQFELRLSSDGGRFFYTACHVTPEDILCGSDGVKCRDDIQVHGDDVNKVCAEMKEALKKRYVVAWEDFIHILVEESRGGWHERELSEGLRIEVGRVRVATRIDGSKCHQFVEVALDGHLYTSSCVQEGSPKVGKPDNRDRSEDCFGLIPYSDNAWARLKEIVAAVKILRERVSAVMTGNDGERILKNIQSSVPMLPGPDKTKRIKHKGVKRCTR